MFEHKKEKKQVNFTHILEQLNILLVKHYKVTAITIPATLKTCDEKEFSSFAKNLLATIDPSLKKSYKQILFETLKEYIASMSDKSTLDFFLKTLRTVEEPLYSGV